MSLWQQTRLNNRFFLRTLSAACAVLLAVPSVPLPAFAAQFRSISSLIALHSAEGSANQQLFALQNLIGTLHAVKKFPEGKEGPFSEAVWKREPIGEPDVIEVTRELLQSEDGLWLQVMYLERLVGWAIAQGYVEQQGNVWTATTADWFERALETAPVVLQAVDFDPSLLQRDSSLFGGAPVLDPRAFNAPADTELPEVAEKKSHQAEQISQPRKRTELSVSTQQADSNPETLLPHLVSWIREQRWFLDKETQILAIKVDDTFRLDSGETSNVVGVIASFRLQGTDGAVRIKRYLMTVIISEQPIAGVPDGDVLELVLADGQRLLSFADHSVPYQQGLIRHYQSGQPIRTSKGGEIVFIANGDTLSAVDLGAVKSGPMAVSTSNVLTVVEAGKNTLVSKTYKDMRGLTGEEGMKWPVNMELPRYEALAKAKYPLSPQLYGASYYQSSDGERVPLGIVMESVRTENELGGAFWMALTQLMEDLRASAPDDYRKIAHQNAQATGYLSRNVAQTIAQLHVAFLESRRPGFESQAATQADLFRWSNSVLHHAQEATIALKARSDAQTQAPALRAIVEQILQFAPYLARLNVGDSEPDGVLAEVVLSLRQLDGVLMKAQVHGDMSSAQGLIAASENTSLIGALVESLKTGDPTQSQSAADEIAKAIPWVDFEGPPSKDSVAQDLDPRESLLVDLAGVLQGFWYIANIQLYTLLGLNPQENPTDRELARRASLVFAGQLSAQDAAVPDLDERLVHALGAWLEEISDAFVQGYLDEIEANGSQQDVLTRWDRSQVRGLVDYWILARAFHELRYETYARDWGWEGIPGGRILSLLAQARDSGRDGAAQQGKPVPLEALPPSDEPRAYSPVEAGIPIGGTFMPFHHMRSDEMWDPEDGGPPIPMDWGSGDFALALEAVDLHESLGLSLMQWLPITWSSAGHSPYSVESRRALEPENVSIPFLLQRLRNSGVECPKALAFIRENLQKIEQLRNSDRIDHDAVTQFKLEAFQAIWDEFQSHAATEVHREFEEFLDDNRSWLPDHMLHFALKRKHMQANFETGWDWRTWEEGLRDYGETRQENSAMQAARKRHEQEIAFMSFVQFAARTQARYIVHYGVDRNVQVAIDIPFVPDGADIWLNPRVFGLSRSNGYRRFVTQGAPPKPEARLGQNWQFYAYDWSYPGTVPFLLEAFESDLDLADYVRLDHVLGYYRAYLFTPEVEGKLTLGSLGVFDQIQAIRERALQAETDDAKRQAVAEVYDVIRTHLAHCNPTEFGLPADTVEQMFDESGNLKNSDSMIMVARPLALEARETNPPQDWYRWSQQVEGRIFQSDADFDVTRISPSQRAQDEGFLWSYLFPENEQQAPKATDRLKLAYFQLAPAEGILSQFLHRAQERGKVVIFETLGTVLPEIQASVERLKAYNYIPLVWGLKSQSRYHPRFHIRNAFSVFGMQDSGHARTAWETMSLQDKSALLGVWFPDLDEAQHAPHLASMTPEVHEKLLLMAVNSHLASSDFSDYQVPLMAVLSWQDILGLSDDYRLNLPGENNQWEKRLPPQASLTKLLHALHVDRSTAVDPIAHEAVGMLERMKSARDQARSKIDRDQVQLLRTTPDTDATTVQIRELDPANPQLTKPFIISASVHGEPAEVNLIVKSQDGKEQKFPLNHAVLESNPEGISVWEIRLQPHEANTFIFEVEVIAPSGVAQRSPRGYLAVVPKGSDLNPLSAGYVLRGLGADAQADSQHIGAQQVVKEEMNGVHWSISRQSGFLLAIAVASDAPSAPAEPIPLFEDLPVQAEAESQQGLFELLASYREAAGAA